MKIRYSKLTERFLTQYNESLRQYSISDDRRRQNVAIFKQFIENLRPVESYPICNKKALGQRFDENGKALITKLRQTYYSDESGYQWSISFYQQNDCVIIRRIIGSKSVKENDRMTEYYRGLYALIYS